MQPLATSLEMAVDERAGTALPARPPFTRPRRPSDRHRKLSVKVGRNSNVIATLLCALCNADAMIMGPPSPRRLHKCREATLALTRRLAATKLRHVCKELIEVIEYASTCQRCCRQCEHTNAGYLRQSSECSVFYRQVQALLQHITKHLVMTIALSLPVLLAFVGTEMR
jgi:hypothetical protein